MRSEAVRRAALVISCALLLVGTAACSDVSKRRTAATLIGSAVFARVVDATELKVVRGRGEDHHRRPYRRAAIITDARATCADKRRPDVTCGVSIEVYTAQELAHHRTLQLSTRGELPSSEGRFVLRLSEQLDAASRQEYRTAFAEALEVYADRVNGRR